MNTQSHFNVQLQALQMTILVVQVFIMAIGGCIFGLGVGIRPMLRIVKPEDHHVVRCLCDLMVSVGLWLLFSGGFNCLSACWKRMWTLYLAMGITCLVIILEMAGIAGTFYLLTQASEFANEEVYRAWYVWECKSSGSCKAAMSDYIKHFMVPQSVLAAISVLLQCLSILYLSRCARCLSAKQMRIWKSREDILNNVSHHSFDSFDGEIAKAATATDGAVAGPSKMTMRSFCIPELDANSVPNTSVANYNTPNSILKGDHGYVMPSNSSLNYDDYANQTASSNDLNGNTTPSISFNAKVEVHYYDSGDDEGRRRTSNRSYDDVE